MALYRHDWTMPNTGWRWRLDIVPYDGALTDTPESMTVDNVPRVVGDLQISGGFDELPVGLCVPYTCAITLVWSALKADLKTRIRNKRSGDARNTFLLYSDRGAGVTPNVLEFAGCNATLEGASYTTTEGGAVEVVVDCVDALYTAMSATSGAQAFAGWDDTASPKVFRMYDIVHTSDLTKSRAYADAGFGVSRLSDGFRYATQQAIHDHLRATMSARLKAIAGRTTATGTTVDEAYDHTDDIRDTYDWCRFAAINPAAYPRARQAGWMDATTIQRITSVIDRDGVTIGGLTAEQDAIGWARYESVWDLHKDLFETSGLKAWYVLSIGTASGAPFIRARWYVLPALEPVGSGKPVYDTARALGGEDNTLEDEAPTVGKTEVRAQYGGKSQPTTDYVINSGVTRAERSFNVQVTIATNQPTTKALLFSRYETGFVWDVASRGVMETHTICSAINDGGFPALAKVHEDTRIHYTATDYVDATSVLSADTLYQSGNSAALNEQVNLWVAAVQAATGLPRAVALLYSAVFGRDDLAYMQITWPLSYTVGPLDDLGHVHELTGTLATRFAGFGWDTAAKVEQTFDAIAGTVSVKYLLWK